MASKGSESEAGDLDRRREMVSLPSSRPFSAPRDRLESRSLCSSDASDEEGLSRRFRLSLRYSSLDRDL